MSEAANSKVIGVVVCDFERAAIGTRSRLGDFFAGEKQVIRLVVERLLQVNGVDEVAVLVSTEKGQRERASGYFAREDRVRVMELERRSEAIDARVRTGRAWNLMAWRGGGGQWTVFDEEYHPAAIAKACAELNADHVLIVHSHGVFLDVGITSSLVNHHLHKNHEMRVSYTPAAPGLCGMVLQAGIVKEMGEKGVMPWQLLSYDPNAPAFDTLIREACMQVDPALSKIPNRFCVDTERGWRISKELRGRKFGSAAEMCLAAARGVAPGMSDLSRVHDWPWEVEIELTGRRFTSPAGSVAVKVREGRAELDAEKWVRWLERHGDVKTECDDLLLTVGGDGDPLLYSAKGGVIDVLQKARAAGVLNICVQTDLAGGDVEGLLAAVGEGLADVVSVTMYGQTAETYARAAQVGPEIHKAVMRNMERLAEGTRGRGGVPLVIPRLLKVRETIPEMEAFFDFWIERCGWAVLDGPTDRAGAIPFAGVVDMAPPKRKACRRIWDRMLVRADGTAVACDQDASGKLSVGNIENKTIQEMWRGLNDLRTMHAAGRWAEIDPCKNCREWHRA